MNLIKKKDYLKKRKKNFEIDKINKNRKIAHYGDFWRKRLIQSFRTLRKKIEALWNCPGVFGIL